MAIGRHEFNTATRGNVIKFQYHPPKPVGPSQSNISARGLHTVLAKPPQNVVCGSRRCVSDLRGSLALLHSHWAGASDLIRKS
jgi:hypothetical protein